MTRLTNHSAEESTPVWLPDGRQIAFVTHRDNGGLYVMNADGSEQTRLTSVCDEPRQAVWSP